MADWADAARRDWATGMGSARTNGLNAMEQVAMRDKVSSWADAADDQHPSMKSFMLGTGPNGERLRVQVSGIRGSVTGVVFNNF